MKRKYITAKVKIMFLIDDHILVNYYWGSEVHINNWECGFCACKAKFKVIRKNKKQYLRIKSIEQIDGFTESNEEKIDISIDFKTIHGEKKWLELVSIAFNVKKHFKVCFNQESKEVREYNATSRMINK